MAIEAVEVSKGISAWEARRRWLEYSRGARTEQDRMLKAAYRQVSRGQKVIDIRETILKGGFWPQHVEGTYTESNSWGLPRLALGRADHAMVYCRCPDNFSVWFGNKSSWKSNQKKAVGNEGVDLRWKYPVTRGGKTGVAEVPPIPPRLRPADSDLSRCYILFEANWKAPPIDPILLRYIDGPFYAVLGAWDLTPLERAVMGY